MHYAIIGCIHGNREALLAVLQAAIARGYVEGWLGRSREDDGRK